MNRNIPDKITLLAGIILFLFARIAPVTVSWAGSSSMLFYVLPSAIIFFILILLSKFHTRTHVFERDNWHYALIVFSIIGLASLFSFGGMMFVVAGAIH